MEDTVKGTGDTPIDLSSNWDDSAQIPTSHLGFLIKLLLPKHLISKNKSKELISDKINRQQMTHFGNAPPCKTVSVGSVAESYALPSVISKAPSAITFGVQYSDTDLLSVWDISPFREYDPKPKEKQQLILETDETYPGYARVFINDPDTVLKNVDPSFSIMLNKKHYLSAKKQTGDLFAMAKKEASLLSKIFQVDSAGPAIGVEDPTKKTLKFLLNTLSVQDRQELVTALPCEWPSLAMEWTTRKRSNDWLTSEMIDAIVRDGCHVVPVAHRHSEHPEIEWRISFATSEVKLTKEVVSDDQRQCYIYLKLLRQIIMKDFKLISSYHCKTVFLYACETLPTAAWRGNAGACIIYLLDMLLHFIKKRCLPSYFLPENNLIGHFNDQEIQMMEKIVLEARKDPIGPVLAFTDSHIIGYQSSMTSFRSILAPVLEDFARFKIHKEQMLSMPAFTESCILMVNSLLIDNKISETVSYILDLYQYFQIYFPKQRIDEYIYASVVHCKLIMQLVQILEKCMERSAEFPDILNLRGYLACLYHCASFNFEPGTDRHRQTVQKASDLYTSVIGSKGKATVVAIDYSNFLIREGKVNQAKEILRELLKTDDKSVINSDLKYDNITCMSVEVSLRAHVQGIIQAFRIASLPSLSVAHYLYVICSAQTGEPRDPDIVRLSDEFRRFTVQFPNFWSSYMHGLLSMEIRDFESAENSFQRAVKLRRQNSMALAKLHISKIVLLLECGNVEGAEDYLENEAFKDLRHINKESFINYILLSLPTSRHSVQLYEIVMKRYPEAEAIRHFASNMSCMRHAAAYEYPVGSDEFETEIALADSLFHTCVIQGGKEKVSVFADYAVFLSKQNRWLDAKNMLEPLLNDRRDCQSSNGYGMLEYNSLDDSLQREITVHGKFEVKAVALAYYILAKCLINIGCSSDQMNNVLSQFNTYIEREKESRMYSLIGYIYIKLQRWRQAEDAFCKAVQSCWDYAAAKQNIAKCRAHLEPSYLQSRKLQTQYSPLCIIPDLAGDMTMDFDKVTAV